MSEVQTFSSTSKYCKSFVAVEQTNVTLYIHKTPGEDNLYVTPFSCRHNDLCSVKTLPISRGRVVLMPLNITPGTVPLAVICPGEWAEFSDGRWNVKQPTLAVRLICDCGSHATYGEGGPHAHWCSTNGQSA
jgi:hypothetical protein